jgi:hypothetical protein
MVHVGHVPEKLVVRHSCDNPICCNYKNHLLIGTVKQNSEDAVERNLYPKGEKHHNSKFTPEQVRIIRSMSFDLFCYQDIADILGCSLSQVCAIKTRRAWKHLP